MVGTTGRTTGGRLIVRQAQQAALVLSAVLGTQQNTQVQSQLQATLALTGELALINRLTAINLCGQRFQRHAPSVQHALQARTFEASVRTRV